LEDIQDTLERASVMLANYRGKLSKKSRIKNYICLALLIIAVISAVATGFIRDSIAWPIIILIIYMLVCYFLFWLISYSSSLTFRQSHFLLAIFCRSENNRFYLNHGMELRPGYLGAWIEINVFKLDD
jgi:hypothetical protein